MSLFSVLLSTNLFLGCGKKPPKVDPDKPNPRTSFLVGVDTLKSPDKKTGKYDYDTALKHFKRATTLDPNYVEAYQNAGWVAEQVGDLEEAAQQYQSAFKVSSNKEDLLAFTDVLRSNGNSAEAIEHLRVFTEKDPVAFYSKESQDKDIIYALIAASTEAEQYEEAKKHIEQILLYNFEDRQAYQLLSRNYHAQKDFNMSLLCAEKANEIVKNAQLEDIKKAGKENEEQPKGDAGILNNMGVTYLEIENEPAAIDAFLSALDADPAHLEANLNLGFVSLASGNYTLAKEKFESALKKHPQNVELKVGLAVALRGLGREGEAEKIYKKLLKEKPSEQIVYFNAATLYEKYFKKYKEAQRILQDYRTQNPDDLAVEERIARVEESERIAIERKKEEERKRKEEAERKKRQKEEFNKLKKEYDAAMKDYNLLKECADVAAQLEEEVLFSLEQVKELIDAKDYETAADAMPFVQDAQATMNEFKAVCGIGGGEEVEQIKEEDLIEETPEENPEEKSEETPEEAPQEEQPDE